MIISMLGIVAALALAAPTFSEFGIWYFVFGLFTALGFAMAGFILLAEPDPQYDIDSLQEVPEQEEFRLEKK